MHFAGPPLLTFSACLPLIGMLLALGRYGPQTALATAVVVPLSASAAVAAVCRVLAGRPRRICLAHIGEGAVTAGLVLAACSSATPVVAALLFLHLCAVTILFLRPRDRLVQALLFVAALASLVLVGRDNGVAGECLVLAAGAALTAVVTGVLLGGLQGRAGRVRRLFHPEADWRPAGGDEIEDRARRRRHADRVLADAAARFMTAPEGDEDAWMADLLSELGGSLDVDHAYVLVYEDEGEQLRYRAAWRSGPAPDAAAAVGAVFDAGRFARLQLELSDRGWLEIGHPSELAHEDPEAAGILEDLGVTTLAASGLFFRGRSIGYLGLETLGRRREWTAADRDLVTTASLMISGALSRRRYLRELARSRRIVEVLAENLGAAFFLVDGDRRTFNFAGPSESSLLGLDGEELSRHPLAWLRRVADADAPRVRRAFRVWMAEGEDLDEEFRLVAHGAATWFRLRIVPARDSAGALRYAGFLENVDRRKESEIEVARRRDQEVTIGARIQRALLLDAEPRSHDELAMGAETVASQRIDGDFFAVEDGGGEVVDLVLGDVMGKGVSAALLGAAARNAFFRARTGIAGAPLRPSPSRVVESVQEFMGPSLRELSSFVTVTYSRFHPREGYLEFVDCGHTPILHYRAATDSCWAVKGSNFPLGFFPRETPVTHVLPFDAGDVLLFYTDGVTEAVGTEGDEFGLRRLSLYLRAHHDSLPSTLARHLRDTIVDFSGLGGLRDDLSVVVAAPTAVLPPVEVFSLPRKMDRLREFRERLVVALTGREPGLLDRVVLAGNEAFSNAVQYGGPAAKGEPDLVRVELCTNRRLLHLRLEYFSGVFDEGKFGQEETLESRSGHGLYIMRRAAASLVYAADQNGRLALCLAFDP